MSEQINFLEALTELAKEKNIGKDALVDIIESSLLSAVKNYYKIENVSVNMDPNTGEFHVIYAKTVVDEVMSPDEEISLEEAQKINSVYGIGDIVKVEVKSRDFGRIMASSAKNTIMQKIREEERNILYAEYNQMAGKVYTGIISRFTGKNVHINLGKLEGFLAENEQVPTESYKIGDRIKIYIVEVKNTNKGPRILVSRTHPELVRGLFTEEVSEIKDGTVEIVDIAREAGSRSKISVRSFNEDVDPVGACVGTAGSRVNAVVDELRGEKIDIVEWDENPAYFIENALQPAKVVAVMADADSKIAHVVVPDDILSLAIGNKGQNARLAAKLTRFKIDIRDESTAALDENFLTMNADEDEYEYEDEDEYEYEYEDEAEDTSSEE